MAATGTPTPNIGLRIPVGTDPASVDDINYNSNLIDTKLGAVGSDSVQDQIDALNGKISKFRQINIVGNTDSGGNRLVQTGYINIISVYFAGYICYPFYLNGNTYIKVLNFSTLEPVPNISVDSIATVIDSGLF